MPGRLPCPTSMLDWFLVDLGFQNPPPKHPCESNYAINIKLKLPIHKNLCLPIHIEIWPHLGAIWAPFWHQKSTNVEDYSPPKGYQKLVRFLYKCLLDCCSILGALLKPCSPPRDPQDGPRAAQDAFRRRLGGVLEPGAAQEAPKRRPDPHPGLEFTPLQASILDNFGSKFWQF